MEKESKEFFIIIQPGLEEITAKEIKFLFELTYPNSTDPIDNKISLQKGGITIFTDLEFGLTLNHFLKTPTRILLRLEKFRCRDFPKLFKKISNIRLEKYFRGAIPPLKISSRRSRLINTTKIEETVLKALEKNLKAFPPTKKTINMGTNVKSPPTLFIHFEDDECQLAIDTTGEPLYKRGFGQKTLEAPIRNNLASAILHFSLSNMKNYLQLGNLNIEKGIPLNLVDPMGGSGVFLLETILMSTPLTRPFSYQYFFPQDLINIYSTKPALESLHWESNYKIEWKNLFYADQLNGAVEVAQNNYKLLPNFSRFNAHFYCQKLQDKSKFEMSKKENEFTLLISNPPYGERIDANIGPLQILQHSSDKFHWDFATLVIPSHWSVKITKQIENIKGIKKVSELSFTNGGLKVKALFFCKQRSPLEHH